MPNQNKPNPPVDELEPHVRRYWLMGMNLPTILEHMKDHYDNEAYGLGRTKLKQLCKLWGLEGTRKQSQTIDSIAPHVKELRKQFPRAGSREIQILLRQEKSIKVPRELVMQYLRTVEPDAVAARMGKRFKRKRFYAAGVNHIWAFDQHDKWKRFGLYFHICVEPFTGKVLWLIVWWTNSNPRLVAHQYFAAVRKYGGVPLLTQSDLGSENFGIANAQTTIRQVLDPTLVGTLQHHWMRGHANIKPEIAWSQFRNRWVPGFEDLFESGIQNGWYNPTNALQRLAFRWLAIPYVQAELDRYVLRHNTTAPRANRHKILPHGIPDVMFEKPHTCKPPALDFKIVVPDEVLGTAEAKWAPPGHPVFDLVDSEFQGFIEAHYRSIGSPVVTFDSFWNVYLALVDHCHHDIARGQSGGISAILDAHAAAPEAGEEQGMALLPDQQEFRFESVQAAAFPGNVHDGLPTTENSNEVLQHEDPLFGRFLMYEEEIQLPEPDEELPAAEFVAEFSSEDEAEDVHR